MSELPFEPPLQPMEARVRDRLPTPPGWAYEPKWDGFRMLAWRPPDGRVRLDSRNRRPLLRYFPELVEPLASLPSGTVVDGEIVVVTREGTRERTDFDSLQQRIHPAASRIALLSRETPAQLVAFDLLADGGEDLRPQPFAQRRERLEALCAQLADPWHLTPSTSSLETASAWFGDFESAGCDGIVAKRLASAYQEGERAMAKVKHRRTVDVVVGGYRVHKEGDRIGSLLLGLHDGGQLHFIGHCSGFADTDRVALLERLAPLAEPESFGQDVRRPGSPSRWSGGKDLSWTPVRAELVCEVSYDQLTGDRFRHATRFERWRPDKEPTECTLDQLERPEGPGFTAVVASTGGREG